jgi:primase-polymerase (primpol)-like protein
MIPAELRDQRAWIAWRLDWRAEQWSKVPLNPRTGGLAKTDEPKSSADLSTALRCMRGGCDGIGLCRTGDYLFIDLDGCLEADGSLRPFPWASKILAAVCGRPTLRNR